jgi:hypothetical protein
MEKHLRPLTRHVAGPVRGQAGGVGGDFVSTGNPKLDVILRIYNDLYTLTAAKFDLLMGLSA